MLNFNAKTKQKITTFRIFFSGIEEFEFGVKSSISLVTDGNGYHGLVEEGATLVNVTPAIQVAGTTEQELLCNIFILQDGIRDDKTPFEVKIPSSLCLVGLKRKRGSCGYLSWLKLQIEFRSSY